jgi:hypothetical protein
LPKVLHSLQAGNCAAYAATLYSNSNGLPEQKTDDNMHADTIICRGVFMIKQKRNLVVTLLAGAVLVAGCGSDPAPETENKAQTNVTGEQAGSGNIKIQTNSAGASINMPGIKINTQQDGSAKVSLPGINVDAKEDGTAKINLGGINIDVSQNGENTNINIDGMKVDAEGEDSSVDMDDMKIESNESGSRIELPDGTTIDSSTVEDTE